MTGTIRSGGLRLAVALVVLWEPSHSQAESGAQMLTAGYTAPAPIEAAPGQVLTLFFRGIARGADGRMREARAQTVPLPYELAGLAVSIHQLPRTEPHRLPLFSVRQHNECEEASGQPVCILTAIRVQIPTELTPVVAKLTVEADGEISRTFLIRPVRDDAHVITACDLIWDTNPGSACGRIAFHIDGSRVDAERPARGGEVITIYAHGLGPTATPVATGTPAPATVELSPAVSRQLTATFAVFRNANPATPRYFEAGQTAGANGVVFAGLVPGQIGLYQINVRVPDTLEIPIPCGEGTESNVLMKVSTARGIENVPLCVDAAR